MRWSYTEKKMRKKEKQNTTFRDYILAFKKISATIVGVQITFLARHNNNRIFLTITLIRKMDCGGRKKCLIVARRKSYLYGGICFFAHFSKGTRASKTAV
jgi:hypothetical protein